MRDLIELISVDDDSLTGLCEAVGDALAGAPHEDLRSAALEEAKRQAEEHVRRGGLPPCTGGGGRLAATNAEEVFEERADLTASMVPFIEFLLVSDRFEFDRRRAVANLPDLVPPESADDGTLVLKAATFMDEHGATTFDASNAAIAESMGEPVCSSDRIYDELDVERVTLEDVDG